MNSNSLPNDGERLQSPKIQEHKLLTEVHKSSHKDKEQESSTRAHLNIDNDATPLERSLYRNFNGSMIETLAANLPSNKKININGDEFHENTQLASEMHQSTAKDTSHISRHLWSRLIYITVLVLYLVLPSVSSGIFDGIICRAFNTNDKEGLIRSYLVADWSIRCDSNSNEFNSLNKIFWATFTVWPILVPLVFVGLLISVRKSVQSKRITFLTEACRFLWQDYRESMLFWEILDIYRKLLLTGLINLIDQSAGSRRIFRLLVAIIVSALYLGILALARPYVQNNDLYLAFTSNVFLICLFSTGIMIHVCQDSASCEKYVGESLSLFTATQIAVIITSVMMAATGASISYISANSINAPTIRLNSTGNRPNIEISNSCQNHVFLSHIWGTGKEKVHTLVRLMQIYLQGVKVWLDVDNLEDMTKLEKSVNESAVFILFYTEGYFASRNCRREVYAAIKANKPFVTVYVNDATAIEDMKKECEAFCTEAPGSDIILESVFANDPVLWLGNSQKVFAIESIKLIVLSVLRHFPYYQKNAEQLVRGLKIGRGLDPVQIRSPLVIYTCHANGRAKDIAEELQVGTKIDIQLRNARTLLTNDKPPNTDPYPQIEVLLLYLNINVFKDPYGEVSELVELSLKKGIHPVLVYEQDVREGKCEFSLLLKQTPAELHAYGLFNELAIPLYTIPEYRIVSMHLLLQKMSDICCS